VICEGEASVDDDDGGVDVETGSRVWVLTPDEPVQPVMRAQTARSPAATIARLRIVAPWCAQFSTVGHAFRTQTSTIPESRAGRQPNRRSRPQKQASGQGTTLWRQPRPGRPVADIRNQHWMRCPHSRLGMRLVHVIVLPNPHGRPTCSITATGAGGARRPAVTPHPGDGPYVRCSRNTRQPHHRPRCDPRSAPRSAPGTPPV
jgi:hypothetical protein